MIDYQKMIERLENYERDDPVDVVLEAADVIKALSKENNKLNKITSSPPFFNGNTAEFWCKLAVNRFQEINELQSKIERLKLSINELESELLDHPYKNWHDALEKPVKRGANFVVMLEDETCVIARPNSASLMGWEFRQGERHSKPIAWFALPRRMTRENP